MLSLFRTNQLFISVLLIFYAALLHLSVFFIPDGWEPGARGVMSDWVYQWLGGAKGLVPDLVAIVLLFVQGTILNALNITHRFTEQISLFPGLFFVLFASLFPEFLHLSPMHLANLFYLLALFDLMAVYNRARSAGYIFNAGLWIGIAGLFYFSYLIFFFLCFIALNILRAFSIRERLMVVSGIITPYLLTGLYFFWNDSWNLFIGQQFRDNMGFFDVEPAGSSTLAYVKLALFSLLCLVALLSQGKYAMKKVIQVQKKISILFWGMLLAGLTILIQAGLQIDHLLILTLPLGMLLSINFINLSRNWAELIHFVLVMIALVFQYLPLLVGE